MIIEKDIPIPPPHNAQSEFYLIVRELKVNDSFFVSDQNCFAKAKTAASNYKNREGKGKDFTSRIVPGGLRIWRIK